MAKQNGKTSMQDDAYQLFNSLERDRIIRSSCQKHACAIQSCLAKVGYKQDHCQRVIETYNECSKRALQRAIEEVTTAVEA